MCIPLIKRVSTHKKCFKGVIFMMMIPRRRNEFDLFDDIFKGDDFFPRRESSIMKTDIKEKKDRFVIEMDLPGYEKENISLSLKDGYLEVSAEVKKEQNSEDDEKFIGRQCAGDQVKQDQ